MTSMKMAEIGTRVRCALHFAGEGVIFAIHGVQTPETVRSLGGGAGVMGGHAKFDVVFHNGHISKAVPEAIVRGIQWQIHDEKADAEEIAQLLEHAERVRIEEERAKQAAAEAFAAGVARLKADPTLSHLTQGDDVYSGLLAAKNMRAALRVAFPRVKFSVRKSHYGSVAISWTDGPTEKEVEAVVGRHKGGYFDGMEDIYKHEATPFVVVFGGAEYVSTYRQHSEQLIGRAIDRVFDEYAGNLQEIKKPAAAEFKGGQLFYVEVPYLNQSLQQLINVQVYSLQG